MNSTTDYTTEARNRNHLRKIIDRIRTWEAKKTVRPKLTIYGDDHGNIKSIREDLPVE